MDRVYRALSRRLVLFVLAFVLAAISLSIPVILATNRGGADPAVATWYGPGFEGNLTASGEPYDPSDLTAAHRTLPFGKKLRVSYGGRSVVVRVNDRGPFSAADIDLSQGAAEKLGLVSAGVAKVEVEDADSAPADPAPPEQTDAPAAPPPVAPAPPPVAPPAPPPVTPPVAPPVAEKAPQDAPRIVIPPQDVLPSAKKDAPKLDESAGHGPSKNQYLDPSDEGTFVYEY